MHLQLPWIDEEGRTKQVHPITRSAKLPNRALMLEHVHGYAGGSLGANMFWTMSNVVQRTDPGYIDNETKVCVWFVCGVT